MQGENSPIEFNSLVVSLLLEHRKNIHLTRRNQSMNMLKKALSFMFILLFLAACNSNSETTGSSNNEENENNEQATIEGDLSFYTSQPDEDAQKLVDTFNEMYPDVNVEIFRSGTEEVVSKLLAENQAGEV